MSLLKVCDICGRAERSIPGKEGFKKAIKPKVYGIKGGSLFDDRPIKIRVPAHNGERYNVFIDVKVEHVDDTKIIDKMYDMKNNFMQSFLDQLEGGTEEGPMDFIGEFKNPHPKICANCKREMLKLAKVYGSEGCTPEI